MNTVFDPHQRLAELLGTPDARRSTARRALDDEQCAQLVALVRASAPAARLRREAWERHALGTTLCLGWDHLLVLGVDFPAGERSAPDGGWVRWQRSDGASHWSLTQREARRIWPLLTAHERALVGR